MENLPLSSASYHSALMYAMLEVRWKDLVVPSSFRAIQFELSSFPSPRGHRRKPVCVASLI